MIATAEEYNLIIFKLVLGVFDDYLEIGFKRMLRIIWTAVVGRVLLESQKARRSAMLITLNRRWELM